MDDGDDCFCSPLDVSDVLNEFIKLHGTVLWRSSITIAHTRAPSQNVSVTFT